MADGKLGKAPCGHPGQAVIGQYYRCLSGCDKAPEQIDFEDITIEYIRCPWCNSLHVEDYQLDAMFYFFNPGSTVKVDTRCIDCGHVFLADN